ncbi:MAG: IPT/TIG domain-containing protein [Dehalococcoidales bacterium]
MKKVTVPNKYIKGLISLAMILLMFMVFVPSSPVLAAPAINLIPSAGAVGTVVTINGTVFDSYKGDNVHIFFDTTEIENSPLTVPVQGAFSIDFTIPASANAGQHWIEVRSETTSSSMLAKNYFTVEATTLTLATPEGGVGTSVNIAGSGFYVNKPVTLYFMNITKDELGTTMASSTGKFTHQFVVPVSTAGFHKIIASNDMGNSAEIQFKVLPKLKLNLDSAGSGDLVSASGTGFASRTTVSIIFGAQDIASTQTDDLGNFKIDFSVPSVKPYSYNVRAQDNQGNTDIVKFTVTAGATLSETIGYTGSELTINGSGFLPGATIYIYYDNNRITSALADNNGDFTATFIVPPGGGKHIITVYDGSTTKKYNFALDKSPPPMPTLLLPNNNSLTIAEANFDWSDVTDNSTPVTYSLQIASDQNFGSLVLSKTGIRESHYTLTKDEILSADFNKAPYYWKIKAIDGADNESEWTSPWVFYVSVPSVPILDLPLPDAKVELPIHFSWQSTASLSLPLTYNLQIATNPDFTSLILNKTGLTLAEYLASEKDDLKLENKTTYYWRVKAIDGVGNSSDWSTTGSFGFIAAAGFPSWAIYILITFGGLIALLLAFRAGRRTAYH